MADDFVPIADTSQGLSQDEALAMLSELPDPEPISRASEPRKRKAAPEASAAAGEEDDADTGASAEPDDDFERAPGDEAEGDGEADDDTGDEDSGEDLITVKVDGEEYQVTREELIAGYQRQSSVTRQSQELKTQKDQFEQARANAVQHYDSMLNERNQALASVKAVLSELADIRKEVETGYDEPDWRALALTLQPHEYNMRQAEWNALQRDLHGKRQAFERAEAVAMEEAGRQRAARAEMAKQKLIEKLPGLASPEKFTQFRAQVKAYAMSELGFTSEELSRITDARPIIAMYKASKYDALVRGQKQPKPKAPAAEPEARRAPPALKPGAPPQGSRRTTESSRDMKRLRETGDQAAALRLINLL